MTDESPAWPLWATEHEAAANAAAQEYGTLALTAPCPSCSASVRPDQRYCENCGADVHPEVGPVARAGLTTEETVKFNRPKASRPPCVECGGEVDADGYCQTCGAKAPSARDHFEAVPGSWLAGVCDRGLVHNRNEDAMALWAASEPDRAAVLVVCDGVSSSQDSDVAALAAAERARDVLAGRWSNSSDDRRANSSDDRRSSFSRPTADAAEPDPLSTALIEATAEAQHAVIENTAPDSPNAASCTLAAAVVEDGLVHWASLGDSRIYFLADDAHVQLSTDHSVAEELIRGGASRVEAENSLQAHAITRWLGRDADDIVPDTGVFAAPSDGWLLLCTDGLWNYASEPTALAEQLQAASAESDEPVQIARHLARWANSQGGKDNITVALARLAANLNRTPQAPSDDLNEPAAGARASSTSVEEKD